MYSLPVQLLQRPKAEEWDRGGAPCNPAVTDTLYDRSTEFSTARSSPTQRRSLCPERLEVGSDEILLDDTASGFDRHHFSKFISHHCISHERQLGRASFWRLEAELRTFSRSHDCVSVLSS